MFLFFISPPLHSTPEETSPCSSLLFPASSLLYYWLFNYIFVLNPPKIFSFFLKFPAFSPFASNLSPLTFRLPSSASATSAAIVPSLLSAALCVYKSFPSGVKGVSPIECPEWTFIEQTNLGEAFSLQEGVGGRLVFQLCVEFFWGD